MSTEARKNTTAADVTKVLDGLGSNLGSNGRTVSQQEDHCNAMAPETNRAALMRLYDTAELRKDTGAKRALEEAINNESVLLRLLAVQSDLNGRGHALDDLLSRCPTSASLTAIVVPIADLLPILTPFRRVLDAQ